MPMYSFKCTEASLRIGLIRDFINLLQRQCMRLSIICLKSTAWGILLTRDTQKTSTGDLACNDGRAECVSKGRTVVSDTGPLISLEKLTDGFGFIRLLYDTILISPTVLKEW